MSWNSTIVLINQDVVNASKAQTETSLKQQEVQSSALSVIIGIDKHLLCTWLSDSIFQTLHQTHQATAMIDLKLEFKLLLHNQSRYNQIKVNSIHLKCWFNLTVFFYLFEIFLMFYSREVCFLFWIYCKPQW